jgi:hypothetical protein
MIRCILFVRDGTIGELADVRFPNTFHSILRCIKHFSKIKNKGYIVG